MRRECGESGDGFSGKCICDIGGGDRTSDPAELCGGADSGRVEVFSGRLADMLVLQ